MRDFLRSPTRAEWTLLLVSLFVPPAFFVLLGYLIGTFMARRRRERAIDTAMGTVLDVFAKSLGLSRYIEPDSSLRERMSRVLRGRP